MATTAILRSHDPLLRHHHHHQPTRQTPYLAITRRRKRSPPSQSNGPDQIRPSPKNNLVMGQVKILKRGETLPNSLKASTSEDDNRSASIGQSGGNEDLILCSTGRLGPEPETVQKEIKVSDLCVGVVSPPPRSLPIPAFFSKKEMNNEAATSGLRRLLKLEMV